MAATNRRDPDHFRVIHLSVQYDHLHLVVEARNKASLSNGMRSVAIRIARSVNALVGRRGRFWADRWHGRALTSPRQVRTALVYVLANYRKHSRRRLAPGIDPFSSGAWFDGWRRDPLLEAGSAQANGSVGATNAGQPGPGAERGPPPADVVNIGIHDLSHTGHDALRAGIRQPQHGAAPRSIPEPPVSRPRTWLASVGWRRYGLLRLDEAPVGAPGPA